MRKNTKTLSINYESRNELNKWRKAFTKLMTNNISESKDYKLQEFSLKQINKNNSFLKKTSFVMDFDCKALTLFY